MADGGRVKRGRGRGGNSSDPRLEPKDLGPGAPQGTMY